MKAIMLGLLASFFFAFTFVLNRAMDLSGGSWIWSASLRFLFMLPLLFFVVLARGNLTQVLEHIKNRPFTWFGWSFIGFGLFYAPLTFAASFGPGWLIAGTWQLTIIAGLLLTPFIDKSKKQNPSKKIPVKSFIFSLIILVGVIVMQSDQSEQLPFSIVLLSTLPIIIAAFAYPLGNRKMMKICSGELDGFQRVFGMTLSSLPFWLLLALYGFIDKGLPSSEQILQTFIVALNSGVIATVLFFAATDMVRGDSYKLAAVEATQSGAVLFALVGEIILLNGQLPSSVEGMGIFLVAAGMILHSFLSKTKQKKSFANKVKVEH